MSHKLRYGIPIDAPASPERLLRDAFAAHDSGDAAKAARLCRQVLRISPRNYGAHQLLGVSCYRQGEIDEALRCFENGVQIDPKNGDGYNNLGNVLAELGRYDEAAEVLEAATRLNPNCADAFNNLGRVHGELGRTDEAISVTKTAIELNPDLAEAYINLGKLLMDVGLTEQGLAVFAKALELQPQRLDAHSNFLMCLQYSRLRSAADLRGAAEAWAAMHAPMRLCMPPPPKWNHARLRVGYVSGDLRAHPVGYTMEKLFPNHDRGRFEVFAYSNCPTDDAVAEGLKLSVECWRNISGMTDDQAALLVRKDEIDILIDLAGHSARNRLGVFARKPAPMQATWMGYFATTGMPQMDYILRDRALIPADEEGHYVERLGLLADHLFCFAPPHEEVDVALPPCLLNGFVTFGSFNNLAKTNDGVAELWSQVLEAVPGSRLYLDRRPLDGEIAREVMAEAFARQGIGRDRLIFGAALGREAYLRAYGNVDVVLDTFPFNGATTTYEALWMGVPVVTRTWDRMVGHFGEAILTGAGHPEWVARTNAEFVVQAVELATDRARLAEIRRNLRAEFEGCPLCDGRAFVRSYEDALARLWEAAS